MAIDKNFYNQASSAKLGWSPHWFGEKYFDEKLVRAVKKWQKEHGLSGDGLVGPMTYARVWTHRQSEINEQKPVDPKYSNYIIYNSEFYPIKWDKMVLWTENGGLAANAGNYYDYTGRSKRNIRLFVNHWDVCLNSTACHRVLNNRGISVHFLIDNDGTIYQTLDMQHGAFHAGHQRTNRASVGVEISNAFYPKYQNWYKRNGHGERPIVEGATVHGRAIETFTDFYPVQVEAAKALWEAVEGCTEVEFQTPLESGETSKKYEQSVVYGNYKGIVSHYHCSKKKMDCANLDIKKLLDDLTNE